jgi:hypothetical protein
MAASGYEFSTRYTPVRSSAAFLRQLKKVLEPFRKISLDSGNDNANLGPITMLQHQADSLRPRLRVVLARHDMRLPKEGGAHQTRDASMSPSVT